MISISGSGSSPVSFTGSTFFFTGLPLLTGTLVVTGLPSYFMFLSYAGTGSPSEAWQFYSWERLKPSNAWWHQKLCQLSLHEWLLNSSCRPHLLWRRFCTTSESQWWYEDTKSSFKTDVETPTSQWLWRLLAISFFNFHNLNFYLIFRAWGKWCKREKMCAWPMQVGG